MDDNAGYVVAGYAITGAGVAAYTIWLWARLRRARASRNGGRTDG